MVAFWLAVGRGGKLGRGLVALGPRARIEDLRRRNYANHQGRAVSDGRLWTESVASAWARSSGYLSRFSLCSPGPSIGRRKQATR